MSAADGEALFRAILTDPADDAPRLVYADWLEADAPPGERDPARAEFIRVQCEITAILDLVRLDRESPTDTRRLHALRARQADLWPRAGEPMLRLAGGAANQLEIHRGFIFSFRGPLASWLAVGPALVARHPVTLVRVTDRRPVPASGGYVWRRGHEYASSVPAPVFAWLVGTHWPNDRSRMLVTEEDAFASLSRACATYARRLAGLPPLA